MKRIVSIASACALFTMPVMAEDLLGGILGNVQNNAKASAFDATIESQAPGAKTLTDNLSTEQKAQLFDYGVENADTIGQVGSVVGGSGGTGAAVLGAGTLLGATQTQQPAYGQPQPVYGQQVPAYQQPVATDVYGNPLPQPTYQGQGTTYVQPQPSTPDYGQPVVTDVYGNPVSQPVYQTQSHTYGQPASTQTYVTATPVPTPQSGITYDPSSGSVSVGADTVNAIGTIIGN